MTTKKLHPSLNQKQVLIQLVEADPQLRSGKFSSSFTKKESERRWVEIAEAVNALNGAKKSWEGWRKTWQDRKANAKKKFALARRQANMTGGGPPPKPPSDEDIMIINMIPSQCLVGHADSQESIVEFIDTESLSQVEIASTSSSAPEKQASGQQEKDTKSLREGQIPSGTISSSTQTEAICHQEKGIIRSKRPLKRQQILETSLVAAENLNHNLKDKNEIKKAFYEKFLQLMDSQNKSLCKIANAINAKNSPYI